MVKVIFTQNLEDYKVGDVKDVPEGYARNFLLKRGMAKLATESEIKNLESQLEKLKKEEEKNVKEAEKIAERLSKEDVVLVEEVNEEGHLYGSIGAKEIAEKIEEMGYEGIGGEDIEIGESFKELGEYEALVKVGHGVETTVKIKVERVK